jgi:hypothetical protein
VRSVNWNEFAGMPISAPLLYYESCSQGIREYPGFKKVQRMYKKDQLSDGIHVSGHSNEITT